MRPLELPSGAAILVRSPNWVGDAVMALPFYDALARLFPASPITVVARPHSADIARLDPRVEVLVQDDRGHGSVVRTKLSVASELRSRRFRAAFILPNSFSSAMLAFLAGIPIRVGYSKDARGLFLTHRIPWDSTARRMHRSDAYLNLLAALGLAPRETSCAPRAVPEADRAEAARLLATLGVGKDERLIAVAPGSVGVSRRWPAERFAGAALELARRLDARILALGGPGDRDLTRAVAERGAGAVIDLGGASPLRLLPALIDRCLLVLSNDSGAAHVAALTSTPTLVLFGAGNEAITRPIGENVHVLRRTLECTPCERNTCHRGDLACLTAIAVDEVVEAAERLVG